jgi:putative membrane protein
MRPPAHTNGAPSENGSPPTGAIADRFEVRATASDHFAWLRTRAALERTMMSWIRTAVSLIGFGFTIVQFFVRMQDIPGGNPVRHPAAPYYLGLSLIFCGVLGLVISIWQYQWTIRYLWSRSFAPLAGMTEDGLNTPVVAIAVLLILIGLFAFFAVLLHFV